MKYSIIIPTLNEEESILAFLSALQPVRDCCEIIVVDGGSLDKTKALAEPFVDKLLSSERGRAVQMNAGADYASGDVLVFLHADTFLPQDALNQIADTMKTDRQWGRFDVELKGSHFMLKIVAFFMNWRSRLSGIATGDQVIFVDKLLFEAVGRYPAIAIMEDVALSKKLKLISSPACLYAKVSTSGRRWEQFGVFKTILLMWRLRLGYFLGEDPQVLAKLYREGKFWKT